MIFSSISLVLTMCPRYSRDKSHIDRFALARVKHIWIRFDGKTRLTKVEEEEAVRLERMREMMDLMEETGIYMVCEERRVDWWKTGGGENGRRDPESGRSVNSTPTNTARTELHTA